MSSSKNYLGNLPDKVLLLILRETLLRETPLWVDQCLQLPRRIFPRSQTAQHYLHNNFIKYRIGRITPPHMVQLSTQVEDSQKVHCRDWILVNSTCQSMRRIGKPLFFSTRPIALSSAMVNKYQSRSSWLDLTTADKTLAQTLYHATTFISHTTLEARTRARLTNLDDLVAHRLDGRKRWLALTVDDQELALQEMVHVVFTDFCTPWPTRVRTIPAILSNLPRVNQCTVLVSDSIAAGYTVPFEMVADTEGYKAAVMSALVKNVGIRRDIQLNIGRCEDGQWDGHRQYLEQTVFPILRR
ncbi:hypothetical protein FALBO_11523 [Fusarium albosuccineum]|uniref:Uncharacterized protein n=1 Tax=Fusarium albosuccineum TaxID=1237068 RepID=A0A8H4L3P4_9HYPO|nr:hypothetical protein FALBO_11523 [Fusarium albosuccineum]